MKLFAVESIGLLLLLSRVESHGLRAVDSKDAARASISSFGRRLQQTGSTEASLVPTNKPTDGPSEVVILKTEGDSNDAKETLDVEGETQGESSNNVEETQEIVEPESYVSFFEGPAFIVGLELNTTSYGQIGRKALGTILSTVLYEHLRLELPFKYDLKSVDIVDIQSMSLELVRKRLRTSVSSDGSLRNLQDMVTTHQFVVTAGTNFASDVIPTQEEISQLAVIIEPDASDFWDSADGALQSTTGAKIFQLRSSASAIAQEEGYQEEEPSDKESSSLGGYLFLGVALVVLIVGVAYYKKTKRAEVDEVADKINQGPSFVSHVSSMKQHESESEGKSDNDIKQLSNMDDGVLFIASESGSDDSFASERGLVVESFTCASPQEMINEIVYDIVEDEGLSCSFSLSPEDAWNDREYSTDIDTVVDDFVQDEVRSKSLKKATNKSPAQLNMKSNGQRSKAKRGNTKKDDDSDSFVVGKHSKRGDELFSVVSEESEESKRNEGCIDPRDIGGLADQVINEIIEEGYDCGLSLAGR